MATYSSAYTGSQIDAGIAQSTVYTYGTVLTGTSGTISSATDLVAAMNAKAPLIFSIDNSSNTVTFYYECFIDNINGTNDYFNYVGIIMKTGLASVTNVIYNLYMLVEGTTVAWMLAKTEVPVPGTTDNDSLMKVISGQYAFSTGLPYTTTVPSAGSSANTDGLKIVVTSSYPATKIDGYLYFVTGTGT